MSTLPGSRAIGLSRRSAIRIVLWGGGATLLSACTSAAPTAPSPPQATAQQAPAQVNTAAQPTSPAVGTQSGVPSQPTVQAKRGGILQVGGVLAPIVPGSPTTYDPYSLTSTPVTVVRSMMFEGLTEIAPDGSVAPGLASSWSISQDGLTYIFKLDTRAKFHNGRAMTSADVKYSFERIRDPATNHPNRSAYDVVASVDSPDPATSTITLKAPYAPLLAILGDVYSSIVPREEVARSDFGLRPVGTGPFQFGGDVPNQSLALDAFKDYRIPGRPFMDGIQITVSADQNAAVLALRAGQFDMLYDAPGENIDSMRQDSSLTVYGGTGQQTFSWLMLNDKSQVVPQVAAFTDVRARQAIFAAIDRVTIANLALPGLTDPLLGGFLPGGHWAALTTPLYPKADLAKARQLLGEAGFGNGFEFELHAASGITHFPRAAQVVQQQLQPLGIKVNITIDQPGGPNLMASGQFQAYFHGTGATIDPDQQFQQSFMPGGGRNYTKFQDDQIASFVKQGQVMTNQADRAKQYQQAQMRLTEVGPMAFVYTYNKYDVAQKFVQGYVYNPILVWRQMRDVWLDR